MNIHTNHSRIRAALALIFALAIVLIAGFASPIAATAQESFRLYAVHLNEKGATWTADLQVEGNRISGELTASLPGETYKGIRCSRAKIKSENRFKVWCKSAQVNNRTVKGDFESASMNDMGGRGGKAEFRFLSGEKLEQFLADREKDPSLTTDDY